MTAVETGLRRVVDSRANDVEFLVRTDVALYQERLVKMGWQPTDEAGLFVRRLDDAPDVEVIFERFGRHIDTMIRQSARLEPVDWERGLAKFADRAAGSGLKWWLYGSAALAIRGLDIQPGDVDLHVSDAYLAGHLMSDVLVEPVTRMVGWVADSGGRAYAGGIVEWLAGAHPNGLDLPHEQEEAASEHLELIEWNGRVIPVPSLELQLAVAERRSLGERATLIRAAIRH